MSTKNVLQRFNDYDQNSVLRTMLYIPDPWNKENEYGLGQQFREEIEGKN